MEGGVQIKFACVDGDLTNANASWNDCSGFAREDLPGAMLEHFPIALTPSCPAFSAGHPRLTRGKQGVDGRDETRP